MFIREAATADAPGIARVLKQIFEIQSVVDVSVETLTDRIERSLSTAAATAASTILVAIGEHEEVVGYCAVHWVPFLFLPGGEAYITELFVQPGVRGLGLGTSLLADVEVRARQRGCARLSLLNGRDGESYQRQFYAKRNWVQRDRMANFVLPLT